MHLTIYLYRRSVTYTDNLYEIHVLQAVVRHPVVNVTCVLPKSTFSTGMYRVHARFCIQDSRVGIIIEHGVHVHIRPSRWLRLGYSRNVLPLPGSLLCYRKITWCPKLFHQKVKATNITVVARLSLILNRGQYGSGLDEMIQLKIDVNY